VTYPRQRLEAHVVSLYRLNVVVACKAAVAVHDEGDMLGNGALLEGADEDLAQLADSPGDGRRGCEPLVDTGVVEGPHGVVWFRVYLGSRVQSRV
jgi:hypothetical protein